MNIQQRIEKKIEKIPESGCWIWTGTLGHFGYGVLKFDKKNHYVHRLSYSSCFGEIPEGMCVLHRCDIPSCVNPHHLFLGTRRDNNLDMKKKGRDKRVGRPTGIEGLRGESCPTVKLREEDVVSIRSSDLSTMDLAVKFGVSQSNVYQIINRITWKHI